MEVNYLEIFELCWN